MVATTTMMMMTIIMHLLMMHLLMLMQPPPLLPLLLLLLPSVGRTFRGECCTGQSRVYSVTRSTKMTCHINTRCVRVWTHADNRIHDIPSGIDH